jgi:hypothetical protein
VWRRAVVRRRDIEKNVARVKEELEYWTKLLDESKARTRVKCESNCYGAGCGKTSMIKDLVYIQTHWYVTPYGCTGGDYWRSGEGQFDCPKCGHRNRLYDRKAIEKLSFLFAEIVDSHDDDGKPPRIDKKR